MPTVCANVTVLECAEPATLEQLIAAGLRRYVVRRLSETAVVLDHERLGDIRKLLKRLGETPRIVTE